MKERRETSSLLSALSALERSLSKLPSEDDRRRALEGITQLQIRLEALRRRLGILPPGHQREEAARSVSSLLTFLRSIQDDPDMAAALDLRGPNRHPRTGVRSVAPKANLEALRASLETLPVEDIYQRLLDFRAVSMAELRGLAKAFGIGEAERLSREDLADKIAKRGFSNPRGYELLRHASSQSQ